MAGEEGLMKQVEELKRKLREVEEEKEEMRRGLEEKESETRRGRKNRGEGNICWGDLVLEGLRAGEWALEYMWNNKVRKTTI